ncbi:HD domain-containing phosphohydrolase [Leeia oryzae]|uniref:HD domain-containing phosphohydrolase n=1 Tax=Leeia oryzae TaxID=356662 RepID=UPI0014617117|nr:HD domain-containing phosphohydrolase [Leeia oryzae]
MQFQMGGLVLIVGLLFSLGSYAVLSKMAENDSERALQLITAESGNAVNHLLQPAATLLNLLSNVPDLKTGSEQDWVYRLPAQASLLRDNKMLNSVYVGGPQGQFLLLRTLRNQEDRNRFNAPPEARWELQIQRINKEEGEDQYWVSLDEKLKVLGRQRATFGSKFDSRTRPWYQASKERDGVLRTKVYQFYSTGKYGVTLAKSMGQGWVIAMDIMLDSIEPELTRLAKAYTARISLLEENGVTISTDHGDKDGVAFFKSLVDTNQTGADSTFKWMVDPKGQSWWVGEAIVPLEQFAGIKLHIAVLRDKLLAKALYLRNLLLIATLVLTVLTLLIAHRNASRFASVFQVLAERASALINFDFRHFKFTGTSIKEIAQLEDGLEQARKTSSNFLHLLEKVSRESNIEKLLPLVLEETSDVAQGENAWLYIYDGTEWVLRAQRGDAVDRDWLPEWLKLPANIRSDNPSTVISVEDHFAMMIPLAGRRGQKLGLLIIERTSPFSELHQNFAVALSGFAALTLESREMIAQQKMLFESFIKLIAEAVDAKSPHTGGHCHRVPILTEWLVELASVSEAQCVANFKLDSEMREAVHIAAWLHDCGKVVTPEYVVDKATKLETLYDRIHEIRMRFEVCKREEELAVWKSTYPQGLPESATEQLLVELKTLDDDFAFIAQCNLGSEVVSEEVLDRIKKVAARTWTRTLDDRLGLSHEELKRRAGRGSDILPTQEYLLSDQPEHKIARPLSQSFSDDNPWGFKMQVPELLYDRGEVKNLSISRGTLTDEERYKINEHIVLTIKMLEAMPFPRHLANVPEIAGGHHERTDGRGYPRAVPASSLSIPARMMAIADVFEALTATDRPYKVGKTIEESLEIMHKMAQGGHLDLELFELFAKSELPARYKREFLGN